eukprot:1233431-Alexandrium_andersonii.AAC.1
MPPKASDPVLNHVPEPRLGRRRVVQPAEGPGARGPRGPRREAGAPALRLAQGCRGGPARRPAR